ncbi:MAG TPA: UrcA family protein [Steroidobacteraceae bacterium]|nr:UrcA family protein [Steroidobacteraceae bacterium]
MMKRQVVKYVVGVALLASGMCQAANAAELRDGIPQIVVNFGDLDLSRAEGVNQLYGRLTIAAERVCDVFDGKALERHAMFLRCKRAALNNAVSRVALPALTTVYARRDPANMEARR